MCVDTMMHLTCTNMPKEKLKEALERVKADGLQNILALRGDPPKGASSFEAVEGGLSCALDLVKCAAAPRRALSASRRLLLATHAHAHGSLFGRLCPVKPLQLILGAIPRHSRYIREEYGDYFGISVAGYPEAHPEVIKSDPEEQKKARAPCTGHTASKPLTRLASHSHGMLLPALTLGNPSRNRRTRPIWRT